MKLFSNRRNSAFTMVEIALCLAIVGFALVAIIGVLPTGMNVQRDNRHQTIINQDAAVWLDAIRNGARGYDDLTNYVVFITNFWAVYEYDATNNTVTLLNDPPPGHNWYSATSSHVVRPSQPDGASPLTNSARIIGLLSTPKYWPLENALNGGIFTSNYVVAIVRSMSGAAAEKSPQRHPDVLDLAFTYRMVAEIAPYVPALPSTNAFDVRMRNLEWNNSTDVRLLFRWPVVRNQIGNGRQAYRQLVTGSWTNYVDSSGQPIYFLQPFSVQ